MNKPKTYSHLLARCINTPLAILPSKLEALISVLTLGPDLSYSGESDRCGKFEVVDGTAIIPIYGTLVERTYGLAALSGLTSYQQIRQDIQYAMSNDDVERILLDIDSPGGEASGCDDLTDFVYSCRGSKDVFALANGMACSAAYQIASSASKIYATQSGISGSIGVIMSHCDQSDFDRARGLRYTNIHAGARKADGDPHKPLDTESYRALKNIVNEYYNIFVGKVARGRELDEKHIRDTEASIYVGKQGIKAGLVDEITTLSDLLVSFRNPMKGTAMPKKGEKVKMTAEELNNAIEAGEVETVTNEVFAGEVNDCVEDIEAAFPEAVAAIRANEATAERNRIKAIQKLGRPGCEAVITDAVDNGLSPEQTAMKIIETENAKANTHIENLKASNEVIGEAVKHVPLEVITGPEAKATEAKLDAVEEKWNSDPDLRAEFLDDISLYRKHLEIEAR